MPVQQHHRASAHPKKSASTHARSSKPVPPSKRSSYSHSKTSSKECRPLDEDEDTMAVSFLQYCAMCEKQIVVPSNSILYCSESCKRKDNQKEWSYTALDQSPPSTSFNAYTFESLPMRDIVPPRSPTAAPSQRSSFIFPDVAEYDLGGVSDDGRFRQDSEAAKYLRQFQSVISAAESAGGPSRPRHNRSSASLVGMSAAPSLSHTPTSTISTSIPYTPSTRPLPPRTNPHCASYRPKSIELVIPFTHISMTAPANAPYHSLKTPPSSKTTFGAVEGEMIYEKKPTLPQPSPGHGSLRQLFASSENAGVKTKWG